MRILTKDEFILQQDKLLYDIEKGVVFVYPTDTIYGIGCNAQLSAAIQRIREIKNRADMPFSVIAPNKEWIRKNCILNKNSEEWLDKLPGPYTLILKLKNKSAVAKEVAPGKDSIGIRIPDHWISKIVEMLNLPIVTTSVNISGEAFANSIEEIEEEITGKIDFAIDEGEKKSRPSTIIHLESEEVKVIKR